MAAQRALLPFAINPLGGSVRPRALRCVGRTSGSGAALSRRQPVPRRSLPEQAKSDPRYSGPSATCSAAQPLASDTTTGLIWLGWYRAALCRQPSNRCVGQAEVAKRGRDHEVQGTLLHRTPRRAPQMRPLSEKRVSEVVGAKLNASGRRRAHGFVVIRIRRIVEAQMDRRAFTLWMLGSTVALATATRSAHAGGGGGGGGGGSGGGSGGSSGAAGASDSGFGFSAGPGPSAGPGSAAGPSTSRSTASPTRDQDPDRDRDRDRDKDRDRDRDRDGSLNQ